MRKRYTTSIEKVHGKEKKKPTPIKRIYWLVPLIVLCVAVFLAVIYWYGGIMGIIIALSLIIFLAGCVVLSGWVEGYTAAMRYRREENKSHLSDSFQHLRTAFDGTAADRQAEKLFSKGYRAWCAGFQARAVHYLKRAASSTGNRHAQARIYYLLSRFEAERKSRVPQSLKAAQKSAQLDVQFDEAWCEWARLLLACGELSNAISRCTEGLIYNPTSVLLLNQRALLWLKCGNFSSALRDSRAILRIERTDPNAMMSMALAYAGLGRDSEARSWFDSAVTYGVKNPKDARKQMEALLEQKNGKTFALPSYTGAFVLENEYQRFENCTEEKLCQALARFFHDDVTFITLRPPAPMGQILFVQGTIVEGQIRLNVGLEEVGRCRVYERPSSRPEAEQIFYAFLHGEIAFDPGTFRVAQL